MAAWPCKVLPPAVFKDTPPHQQLSTQTLGAELVHLSIMSGSGPRDRVRAAQMALAVLQLAWWTSTRCRSSCWHTCCHRSGSPCVVCCCGGGGPAAGPVRVCLGGPPGVGPAPALALLTQHHEGGPRCVAALLCGGAPLPAHQYTSGWHLAVWSGVLVVHWCCSRSCTACTAAQSCGPRLCCSAGWFGRLGGWWCSLLCTRLQALWVAHPVNMVLTSPSQAPLYHLVPTPAG